MSDSSPLIPQGSLLEAEAKGRPHLRIALCIVAVHMVFLGGLLMQGCKREAPSDTAKLVLPPLEESAEFPPLPGFEDLTNAVEDSAATNAGVMPPDGVLQMGSNTFSLPIPEPELTNAAPTIVPEPGPEPEPPGVVDYTVQRGDYFFSIARKFDGVTAADIARANPGVDSTRLQIGQVLKIPTAGSARATPGEAGTAQSAGTQLYTVKRGDTLTRIAGLYGTTVPALKELNGLVTDRIIINQKLKVPAPAGGGGTPRD